MGRVDAVSPQLAALSGAARYVLRAALRGAVVHIGNRVSFVFPDGACERTHLAARTVINLHANGALSGDPTEDGVKIYNGRPFHRRFVLNEDRRGQIADEVAKVVSCPTMPAAESGAISIPGGFMAGVCEAARRPCSHLLCADAEIVRGTAEALCHALVVPDPSAAMVHRANVCRRCWAVASLASVAS